MIETSIGVFAYNEERTIAQTLAALLGQETRQVKICEILVISSGSTDRTDQIVIEMATGHPKLRLIREKERMGKAIAINRYLAECNRQAGVNVLVGADLLPESGAVEQLVIPFNDETVGMTGGRPMPVNDSLFFLGFVVQLQWTLHHLIALSKPKCGEMVAFRAGLIEMIPAESPVDEASIEAICLDHGLQMCYVPTARFRNRGPETIREFVAQRRRIASGHQWLRRTTGYRVATGSPLLILETLLSQVKLSARKGIRPREWIWMLGAIGLEGICRILGTFDCIFRPNAHQAWKMVQSTKRAYSHEKE